MGIDVLNQWHHQLEDIVVEKVLVGSISSIGNNASAAFLDFCSEYYFKINFRQTESVPGQSSCGIGKVQDPFKGTMFGTDCESSPFKIRSYECDGPYHA